jgi:hypothetical protein
MWLVIVIQSLITHATYLNTDITNVFCTISAPTSSNRFFNFTVCASVGFILYTLCLTTIFQKKPIFYYVLSKRLISANCTLDYFVFWNSTVKYKAGKWVIQNQRKHQFWNLKQDTDLGIGFQHTHRFTSWPVMNISALIYDHSQEEMFHSSCCQ